MPNLGGTLSGFGSPNAVFGFEAPTLSPQSQPDQDFAAIDQQLGLAPELGAVENVNPMGDPLGWSNVAPPAPPTFNAPVPSPVPQLTPDVFNQQNMDKSVIAVPPPSLDKNVIDPQTMHDLQTIAPVLGMPIAFQTPDISLAPPEGYEQAFNAPMSMSDALNATLAAMNPSMAAPSEDTSTSANVGDTGDTGDAGDEGGGTSAGIGSEGGGGDEGGGTSAGIGSEGGGGGAAGASSSGGIGSEGGGGGPGDGGNEGGGAGV